ncbi:STAS domain-containing protein [Mycobacterium sp. IDR2000157661]|uniref:STAS domain-containing protein n=1 Tax=Mycobacterium sp. IDR2000157661 TaxID=2867005 RepID=UPI001EEA2170|nr:STAS domain-containing protein [Mycobacterium sp. IDR2000157661]ULE33983.1 STAS domain-containing protein [Mycobacterium sp. IDR2000157661]
MPSISIARRTPSHKRERLAFATEWVDSYVVRITVAGDVDASNAQELREYVLRRAANCRSLVLDLNDVTFFSTAGFSMLRTIGVRCDRANVRWTLNCNPAVARVIEVCDPDRTLASRMV